MHFYQTWICATGARHSKSMERRSQRTVCLRAAEYYPGCALIRDLQGFSAHSLQRERVVIP